jgi:hypothetical protein
VKIFLQFSFDSGSPGMGINKPIIGHS